MHTGSFASNTDPRFLRVDIGGLRVGLVSFMDPARQKMKRATFSEEALRVLFSPFDHEAVQRDIAAAREAGADFIVAYGHWGREYTQEVTERQRRFGQLLADSGADLIVGAHPHCLQAFEFLNSSDDRRVPCLWSAGNFLSSLDIKRAKTRETLALELVLDESGRGPASLVSLSYIPMRIMHFGRGEQRRYAVLPTSAKVKNARRRRVLDDAEASIARLVGPELERSSWPR